MYGRINVTYWSEISAGWPESAKLLGAWMMTCEHAISEGLFRLPRGYIAADLAWTPRRVDEHLQTLIDDGFVRVDDDAQVVLIPEMLREQQPKGSKSVRGAINRLRRVPRSPLLNQLYELACGPAPDGSVPLAGELAAALREEFGCAAPPTPPDRPLQAVPDAPSDGVSDVPCDTPSGTEAKGDGKLARAAPAGALPRSPSPSLTPSPTLSPLTPDPPSPPDGKRQRDLHRFAAQMAAWHERSRPGSEEEERWSAIRAALAADLGVDSPILSALHPHASPSGRLVLGFASRELVFAQVEPGFGPSLRRAAHGQELQLVDCTGACRHLESKGA